LNFATPELSDVLNGLERFELSELIS